MNKLLKQNEIKFFLCEKILYDANFHKSAIHHKSIESNHNIITEKIQFHLVS